MDDPCRMLLADLAVASAAVADTSARSAKIALLADAVARLEPEEVPAGVAGALAGVRLEVGCPVQPMLASPAAGLDAAFARLGPAAVEFKLDGVRIQDHRRGADVAVITRTLDDATARLPEVVAAAGS